MSISQIYASTVKLLDDMHLEELGIDVMGDRATLREACSQTARSECAKYVCVLEP